MSRLDRHRWILTSLAFLLSVWLLRSFLVPLAWAFIIALASWPLYRRFANRMPARFGTVGIALLFTVLMTVFVLGPFGYAFFVIAEQAEAWAREIAVAEQRGLAPPEWLAALPFAGAWLVDQWNGVLGTAGGVSGWLRRTDSAVLAGWAGSAGGFVLHHAMIVTFTILALFFFYHGGEPLAGRITQFVHDTLGQRGDSYFRHADEAIRATMRGMIVVFLIDGVLCGAAYALADVPSAHVWAAITGLMAMIPFMAYFAVAAAALVVFAKGASAAAVMVLAWGGVVVFVADKFVRTALIGRSMKLGFFWALAGGLGGLETFGLLGLLIGPVIVSVTAVLLRDLIRGELIPNHEEIIP